MKPKLKLGKTGNDGDLIVRDSSKVSSVQIDGDSGDVTNSLSGNGLVKAWARIKQDGTVDSCYRCNLDGAETRKIPATTGQYEVDFTPLGTSIQDRPRVCSQHKIATGDALDNLCANNDTSGDTSSVDVRIWDVNNAANAPQDSPFTIVIF